jgi:hypothetical protein
MDWQRWHGDYDRPGSSLARRLPVVQGQIRQALDACAPGPVRVVSLCAGQGRDLIEVLAVHPRREDVRARLVELDAGNAAIARAAAETAGLAGVEVVTGDAACSDHYRDLVPAQIVLVCGVFGNITDGDVQRTVGFCAAMCATGGTVVWTRHREPPDLVPRICDWFAENGFDLWWLSEPGAGFGVGAHRFRGEPPVLPPGERMFTFVGFDALR